MPSRSSAERSDIVPDEALASLILAALADRAAAHRRALAAGEADDRALSDEAPDGVAGGDFYMHSPRGPSDRLYG